MSNCNCPPETPDCDCPEEENVAINCEPVTQDCDKQPTLKFAHEIPTTPYVPPSQCIGTADYSTSDCADSEAEYVAGLMAAALNAAGGPVNLFPMLGVHNQGSTIDQAKDGYPLSGGTPAGVNILNGFNINDDSWRSIQVGAAVTSAPAYIGYDFGTKKAWNLIGTPQERYAPSAPVRKHIRSIRLKQGSSQQNRATQLKIEACDDGVNWKRIDVVKAPDNGDLNTIGIKQSAEYKCWRIVPVYFLGIAANTFWEVVQLELLEANTVSLDNIQDQVLSENRDRAYCRSSVMLKCQYDLMDVQTEMSMFGINLPQTYIFTVSFAQMVKKLGRPVIVGDIIELPGEAQYDFKLNPVRKWLEVTDTGWSTEGYTFNWKPNLFRFFAQPILPSVEHKDILGLPGKVVAAQSTDDFLAGNFLMNQQPYDQSEHIAQEAASAVPQTGSDPQDILSGMNYYGKKGSYDGRGIYSEDAIPPDGAPYTTGDSLPLPADIIDGHYHRQTYNYITNKSARPPERLIRWNADIQRWKVIEVNSRKPYESYKPTISRVMQSDNRKNIDDAV